MPIDILFVSLRALGFVALFQAAGMVLFLSLLEDKLQRTEPVLRRLGTFAALLAAICLSAQYFLEAARMSGELPGAMDPALQSLVLHSAASVSLSCRLLGLLLIVWSLRRPGRAGTAVGVIGVVVLLAAFTFVGHTSTHAQRWLLSPVLLAHVLVVAFWFGALLPLYLISSRESAEAASRIVGQFSARAIRLVPMLLLAGVMLAAMLLPDLAALHTPYGELLTVKLIGFSSLMPLAALNKWRFGPALRRSELMARRRFQYTLAAEYGLIAAILCVTAVMTTFYSPEG